MHQHSRVMIVEYPYIAKHKVVYYKQCSICFICNTHIHCVVMCSMILQINNSETAKRVLPLSADNETFLTQDSKNASEEG